MRLGQIVLLMLLLTLGIASIEAQKARADEQEGVIPVGSSTGTIFPVLIGAPDANGKARFVLVTPNGAFAFDGVAVEGSTTGQPLKVAGVDASGLTRVLRVVPQGSTVGTPNVLIIGGSDGAGNAEPATIETSTNTLHVTEGVNLVLDALTPSYQITSSGVNVATIFTGVASKRWILASVTFKNTGGSAHDVVVYDSNGKKAIDTYTVPASGCINVNLRSIVLNGGSSFQFTIDAGGSSTDVKAYAWGVNK